MLGFGSLFCGLGVFRGSCFWADGPGLRASLRDAGLCAHFVCGLTVNHKPQTLNPKEAFRICCQSFEFWVFRQLRVLNS